MNTIEQQLVILNTVAQQAAAQVVNCVVVANPGDVVFVKAANVGSDGHQVVAASSNGLFDIWKGSGALVEADVPLERAVAVIVADYRKAKAALGRTMN